MARLTEEMVIARSKQSDLAAIKKLNCWGAELGDVSLLRRMPNLEVVALSINKIRTLDDFALCRRLRELYIRKNDIRDLREIRHLRRLPDLTSLWLDENPCTDHPEYRMTVLRNLPNLEKLDNVPVYPEEVQEAMRRGVHIPDSDDEGYPQQESYGPPRGQYRRRSSESSPEREEPPPPRAPDQASDGSEAERGDREPPPDAQYQQCEAARRLEEDAPPAALTRSHYEYQQCEAARRLEEDAPPAALTRSHYEARRSPDAPLRHSLSAQSVKEYSYGECRLAGRCGSPPAHDQLERPDRSESYQQVPQRCADAWERDGYSVRERDRDSGREYPSAVMGERRGFTRRPVARNSNLLSAVLCLVKELDYPSLEVAEMAVRCRMDELANSQ